MVFATADPLREIAEVATPLHAAMFVTVFTLGLGFTIILNDAARPTQVLAVGVTVNKAVSGIMPVFVPLKVAILLLPLAAKPIMLRLLVHAKVVPLTALVKLNAPVAAPLQTVKLLGTTTFGVGLAVIVKFLAVPLQPLAKGLTLKLAITGTVPVLIALKVAILPLPLPAKPILLVLFVQL